MQAAWELLGSGLVLDVDQPELGDVGERAADFVQRRRRAGLVAAARQRFAEAEVGEVRVRALVHRASIERGCLLVIARAIITVADAEERRRYTRAFFCGGQFSRGRRRFTLQRALD